MKVTYTDAPKKFYSVRITYKLGGSRDTFDYIVQALNTWEALKILEAKLLAAPSTVERLEIGEAHLAGVLL